MVPYGPLDRKGSKPVERWIFSQSESSIELSLLRVPCTVARKSPLICGRWGGVGGLCNSPTRAGPVPEDNTRSQWRPIELLRIYLKIIGCPNLSQNQPEV